MSVLSALSVLPCTLVLMGGPPCGAERGTIVFMPDVGGNLLYARPLVAPLSEAAACIGTRLDRTLLGRLDRLSVPDLGRRFAADLLQADLPRPLHLVGFSFAGLVAFETARHLAAANAPADGVWLIDTQVLRKLPGEGGIKAALHRPLAEVNTAIRFLWRNRRRFLGQREPYVLHRYGHLRIDLSRHPEGHRPVIRGLYRALVAYRPEPWPTSMRAGRTVLIRAGSEQRRAGVPDDLGWRRLTPTCEVVHVTGDHLSMLREAGNAAQVADVLLDGLASYPRSVVR